MILLKTPEDLPFGQVAVQGLPCATPVRTLDEVGIEVTHLVGIQDCIHGIDIVKVGLDVIDKRLFGHAIKTLHTPPVGPAVLGHLDEPVVRAHIDQASLLRRFGDGRDVAILGHGGRVIDGIEPPDPFHVLERISVALA